MRARKTLSLVRPGGTFKGGVSLLVSETSSKTQGGFALCQILFANYFARPFLILSGSRTAAFKVEEPVAAAQHVALTASDRQIKEITTNRGSFVIRC